MKLAAVTTPNNIVFLYVVAAVLAALLVFLGVQRLRRIEDAQRHTRKLAFAFVVVIGLPLLGALTATDSTAVVPLGGGVATLGNPLALDDYGRQVVIGWAFSVPLFGLGLWFSAMRLMTLTFNRNTIPAVPEERQQDAGNQTIQR